MSTAQILQELPNLTANERSELFTHLAKLHESDLLAGEAVSTTERKALDAALADFESDPNPGEPWRQVIRGIEQGK